jgi:hypothetical protein
MPGDDKIGSANEERQKLQKLEAPLRNGAKKDPNGEIATQAGQALQAEVNKINNSKAFSDNYVRAAYVDKLVGFLGADDIQGIGSPDGLTHLSTIIADTPGHLKILANPTIAADENRARANDKLHFPIADDVSYVSDYLHAHHFPDDKIESYQREVFGASKDPIKTLQQYEREAKQLKRAVSDLYKSVIGLPNQDGKAPERVTQLLNTLGDDHLNHLVKGFPHFYIDCFELKDGHLKLKSEADLKVWANEVRSKHSLEI